MIAVFLGLGALIGGTAYFILPSDSRWASPSTCSRRTLIAGLQAFIFASLSAIYIGGAIHPDH